MSSPHFESDEEKTDQLGLTDFDLLQNIQNAYSQSFNLNTTDSDLPLYPLTKKLTAICPIINVKNITALRLINFYKKMHEFQLCTEEDKVTLIKHNLPCIFFLHAVLSYDPLMDRYYQDDKHHIDGRDILLSYGLEVYSKITTLMTTLRSFVELDRIIIQLALVIMLFSKGFSASDSVEPILIDPLKVFRIQNLYIERLWRFLENRFGNATATKMVAKLFMQCLTIQILSRDTRSDISENVNPYDIVPIMRSIMQLV
ncbi:unnamed protein product [Didymodactylos carnosus]|uniref:NR LBD domain-containing protein n=1 Tax=Didymodactylos carnosus TaxID=1234261 RepID=A0A813Q578_9BILA|nr:unnamed protein product [Didymodactylos carnosus]CAF1261508.1 unnamed protein product [Didymodactylos carnosus]CAF3543187.1 unnamed protein product [Didymodactylos carnosus]CAF4068063.1 unnamed protein product [Didymodactylos carnosus]